jgi:hypothetical protein
MTPVLVLGFNRPDAMTQTCSAVASLGYDEVYLGVDGSRETSSSDQDLIDQTVEVFMDILGSRASGVLRQSTNRGCAAAVPAAIDWFFDHVESGLILEDDCVPTVAAAEFVEEGLTRYRSSETVCLVSCGTFAASSDAPAAYLTRFPQLWGWATWRDKWKELRPESNVVAHARRSSIWRSLSPMERRDWSRMLRLSVGDTATTWDYGLVAQLWSMDGLALTPSIPLVRNIGFGPSATHAETAPEWYWESGNSTLQEFAREIQTGAWPTRYEARLDEVVRREVYSPSITFRVASKVRRFLRNKTNASSS